MLEQKLGLAVGPSALMNDKNLVLMIEPSFRRGAAMPSAKK